MKITKSRRRIKSVIEHSLRIGKRKSQSNTVVRLSPDDQVRVAEVLLNPPQPVPGLKRAFARRKQLLTE